MKRYRRKSNIVEAEQFMGCGWYEANNKPYPKHHCDCSLGCIVSETPHSHVHMFGDDQIALLSVGDYIVKRADDKGSVYPMKSVSSKLNMS